MMPDPGKISHDSSLAMAPEGFKNPTDLTKWLRRLLILSIVLSAIGIWSSWLEYELLTKAKNGILPSESEAHANDTRQFVIGMVQTAVFIITGIVFLIWIHRANHNARKLGTEGMSFTPGWAVAWYFIPIANLWKPYQAMKEIWKASNYASPDWKTRPGDPILGWWWLLWIISAFLGRVSLRLATKADEIDELMTASIVTSVTEAIDILLCLVAMLLVGRVFEMQMSRLGQSVPTWPISHNG